MRYTMVVMVAAAVGMPAAAWGQGREPAPVVGAAKSIYQDGLASEREWNVDLVRTTADGLVEITIARPVRREQVAREDHARSLRALYRPEAVLAWADAVDRMLDSLREVRAPGREGETVAQATLEASGSRRIRARARRGAHAIAWELEVTACGSAWQSDDVMRSPDWIRELLRRARTASLSALQVPAARRWTGDARVYAESAVGCPAMPLDGNPLPSRPGSIPAGASTEALASFVVDSGGRPELETLRFPRAADPAFAAEVRRALRAWRFRPAERAGTPVRQLVHVPFVLEPELPGGAEAIACAVRGASGVTARVVADGGMGNTGGAGITWLDSIARQVAALPGTLPGAGRVLLLVRRDGSVAPPVASPNDIVSPAAADSAQAFAARIPRVLPIAGTFLGDFFLVEIGFGRRCAPPLRTRLRLVDLRLLPFDDGTIELASLGSSPVRLAMAESEVARDVLPAAALRHWFATVAPVLAGIDSARAFSGQAFPGDRPPPVPALGYGAGEGLRLEVSHYAMLMGNAGCEGGAAGMEVNQWELREIAAVLRNATRAGAPTARAPRGRPYFRHEVACPALPRTANPVPALPAGGDEGSEVLVSLVVDAKGAVVPATIEPISPVSAEAARAVRRAVAAWRFVPARRGGKAVEQRTHVTVALLPASAPAVARQAPPRPAPRRGEPSRTIFWSPPPKPDTTAPVRAPAFDPPPDRPQSVTSHEAWNEAVRAMQPYVDQARATWPQAKARFLRGLGEREHFFVTVRLRDAQARVEQSFIEVLKIERGLIHGRIQSEIGAVSGYRRGDPYLLPEAELVDWTIVRADGSEEGNFVGRFLDTYRPPRPR